MSTCRLPRCELPGLPLKGQGRPPLGSGLNPISGENPMHLPRSLIVLASSIILSSTGLTACAGAAAPEEEDVGSAAEDGLSMNGLSMSALTMSNLSMNGP